MWTLGFTVVAEVRSGRVGKKGGGGGAGRQLILVKRLARSRVALLR